MEALMQALSDPQRRAIVSMLLAGERPVGELVEHLPIAQSGVSRHLRVLREAGVVSSRAEGQRRIYGLCPGPFQALELWLAPYRRLWEERLDRFENELDRRLAESDPKPPRSK